MINSCDNYLDTYRSRESLKVTHAGGREALG